MFYSPGMVCDTYAEARALKDTLSLKYKGMLYIKKFKLFRMDGKRKEVYTIQSHPAKRMILDECMIRYLLSLKNK